MFQKISMFALWKKSYDQPRQHVKEQRYYFTDKGLYNQTMVFPVVMHHFSSVQLLSRV